MRSLLLLVIIGVASASYVDKLFYRSNPTVREAVNAFKAGGMKVPALRMEGMPFIYSVKIQRDLISQLAEQLETILQNVTAEIQAAVEAGEGILEQLVPVAEHLVSQLQAIGGKIWEQLHTWLQELANKFGGIIGDFINHILNTQKLLTKLTFTEVVNSLINWITGNETLQSLIEYIQSIPTQLAEMAANFLQNLNFGDIAQLIMNIIQGTVTTRGLGDIWNNITDFFEDLISNLPGKWETFTEWISSIWDSALAAAENKLEQIQIIAQEFINNAHNLGGTVAQQVLEFLKPFADQLGDLWDQAVEAAGSAITGGGKH